MDYEHLETEVYSKLQVQCLVTAGIIPHNSRYDTSKLQLRWKIIPGMVFFVRKFSIRHQYHTLTVQDCFTFHLWLNRIVLTLLMGFSKCYTLTLKSIGVMNASER
jgi:hypothetical protein